MKLIFYHFCKNTTDKNLQTQFQHTNSIGNTTTQPNNDLKWTSQCLNPQILNLMTSETTGHQPITRTIKKIVEISLVPSNFENSHHVTSHQTPRKKKTPLIVLFVLAIYVFVFFYWYDDIFAVLSFFSVIPELLKLLLLCPESQSSQMKPECQIARYLLIVLNTQ